MKHAISLPPEPQARAAVNHGLPPEGFATWWINLQALAGDLDKLLATWRRSNGRYRRHVARTHRQAWEELQAKAAAKAQP